MCEFCTQHGEGEKWYLNVRNYATELLHDPGRLSMIRNFYRETVEKGNVTIGRMEMLYQRNPKVLNRIKDAYAREMKAVHYGQVLPLEEVVQVLSLCNTAVRLPCGCRWAFDRKEKRVCFGISFGGTQWFNELDTDYFGEPDVGHIDDIDREKAVDIIKDLDRQGMVHSIWTFQTPFIGAICNCELKSCLAMRATVGIRMPLMFKAEGVALVEAEKCTGCRECMHMCQFNAIEFREADNRSLIKEDRCFGCGVCRNACPENAIRLTDRTAHPLASSLW